MALGIILIGGPCDGMKTVVPDGCTMHMVYEKPPMKIGFSIEGPPVSVDVECRRGIYRADNDRQVFNWQGWEE